MHLKNPPADPALSENPLLVIVTCKLQAAEQGGKLCTLIPLSSNSTVSAALHSEQLQLLLSQAVSSVPLVSVCAGVSQNSLVTLQVCFELACDLAASMSLSHVGAAFFLNTALRNDGVTPIQRVRCSAL